MEKVKVAAAAWASADLAVIEFMIRALQASVRLAQTSELRTEHLATLRSALQQFRGEHLALPPSDVVLHVDQSFANKKYRERVALLCLRIEQAIDEMKG